MKINTKKNHKPIIISLIAIALIVLVATGYLFFIQSHKDDKATTRGVNTVDYGPPTKAQEAAGNSTTNNSANPNDVGSDRPKAPTAQANNKSLVTITITSPADQRNGNILQVRADIGVITSTGTCTLTLTKGVIVKKQVGVQALPSSSTCKGFDVPTSELSSGQWAASLTFENDSLIGIATQTVLIR